LDAADSGLLRLYDLACPPYRGDALAETAEAYRGLCRVTGGVAGQVLSIDIEVLPEHAQRGREVVLSLLNHLLDLSIRKHFQCC
jgi:hypothetical protein